MIWFPSNRGGIKMSAKSPEEICRLFQHYMAEGDIDSVLSVYDPEAVFLNQSGEVKKGEAGLSEVPRV
jgi:ketosteroid isomerase-like protein